MLVSHLTDSVPLLLGQIFYGESCAVKTFPAPEYHQDYNKQNHRQQVRSAIRGEKQVSQSNNFVNMTRFKLLGRYKNNPLYTSNPEQFGIRDVFTRNGVGQPASRSLTTETEALSITIKQVVRLAFCDTWAQPFICATTQIFHVMSNRISFWLSLIESLTKLFWR